MTDDIWLSTCSSRDSVWFRWALANSLMEFHVLFRDSIIFCLISAPTLVKLSFNSSKEINVFVYIQLKIIEQIPGNSLENEKKMIYSSKIVTFWCGLCCDENIKIAYIATYHKPIKCTCYSKLFFPSILYKAHLDEAFFCLCGGALTLVLYERLKGWLEVPICKPVKRKSIATHFQSIFKMTL